MQFGYGHLVDQKLADLNWTKEQYDFYLNHLHCELDRNQLVQLLLELADKDWLESTADGIGTFDLEEDFNPGNKQDWEVLLCGDITVHAPGGGTKKTEQWAVFNVKTGEEWKDDNGWGRAFESEQQAQSYLNGFFDALETK